MYAEVAIPLNVHQTFTYRLPENIAANVRPGARALVPFGRQLLTGYIVDLHETLEEAGQAGESFEIKEVEELFDIEPLVTPELLDLTKWIADYYYAPWGETIKSSLPAGINSDAEALFTITEAGREALVEAKAKRPQLAAKMEALEFIAQKEDTAMNELVKQFEKNRASAIARELQKSNFVMVKRQLQTATVKAKKQQAVRLIQQIPAEGKPLNEQQQKVIKLLAESAEPVALTALTEQADISPSVIRTLEKRGCVEVFAREIRRNPLAHMPSNQYPSSKGWEFELTLTNKQQAALTEITAKLDEEKYAAFLLHGVTG
ncbi:MAG: hypothetical protein ACRD82_08275, partial [Blastocatellia bacterium]